MHRESENYRPNAKNHRWDGIREHGQRKNKKKNSVPKRENFDWDGT